MNNNMVAYEPVLKIYDSFHEIYEKEYMGSRVDQYALLIKLAMYIEEKQANWCMKGEI